MQQITLDVSGQITIVVPDSEMEAFMNSSNPLTAVSINTTGSLPDGASVVENIIVNAEIAATTDIGDDPVKLKKFWIVFGVASPLSEMMLEVEAIDLNDAVRGITDPLVGLNAYALIIEDKLEAFTYANDYNKCVFKSKIPASEMRP
jgi:hypothetical protein